MNLIDSDENIAIFILENCNLNNFFLGVVFKGLLGIIVVFNKSLKDY